VGAGHDGVVGAREPARAQAVAEALSARAGRPIRGGDHAAAADAGVVVLCVPYAAHDASLRALAGVLAPGTIVVDLVVPLAPPAITRVQLPEGGAAALAAQRILGERARVVATLHHVSAAHLERLDQPVGGDVLLCSDDAAARDVVLGLLADLGLRGLDAGPLANAVALEAMTPVLLHLNRRYRRTGLGLRIAGLEDLP
jgi:8-hydroxy-5-deazaflavin:NADPH oxidoreductase